MAGSYKIVCAPPTDHEGEAVVLVLDYCGPVVGVCTTLQVNYGLLRTPVATVLDLDDPTQAAKQIHATQPIITDGFFNDLPLTESSA